MHTKWPAPTRLSRVNPDLCVMLAGDLVNDFLEKAPNAVLWDVPRCDDPCGLDEGLQLVVELSDWILQVVS